MVGTRMVESINIDLSNNVEISEHLFEHRVPSLENGAHHDCPSDGVLWDTLQNVFRLQEGWSRAGRGTHETFGKENELAYIREWEEDHW